MQNNNECIVWHTVVDTYIFEKCIVCFIQFIWQVFSRNQENQEINYIFLILGLFRVFKESLRFNINVCIQISKSNKLLIQSWIEKCLFIESEMTNNRFTTSLLLFHLTSTQNYYQYKSHQNCTVTNEIPMLIKSLLHVPPLPPPTVSLLDRHQFRLCIP